MILEFILLIVGFVVYGYIMLGVLDRKHQRDIEKEEQNHVRNCPICSKKELEEK